MLKLDFFHKAMQAKRYMDVDWLTCALSVTRGEGATKSPYDIVSNMSGYFYLDEELKEVKIDDAVMGQPLFNIYEKIMVKPGDAPNISKEYETDYGNLLFNWIVVVHPFGDLFEFVPKNLKIGDIEAKIEPIFEDDLEEGQQPVKGKVYVKDYLLFTKCCFFLVNLNQLVTCSITEKISLPPDGLDEFKEKLFKEYEGREEDPIVVAEMEKRIFEFDEKYREGDPGNRFIHKKNQVKVVRKKALLIFGTEPHPSGDPSKVFLVKRSLNQGLDLKIMPILVTSLRGGVYARGKETQFGGVVYKDLVRALSGNEIVDGYCGTKRGLPYAVNESNLKKFVGFSIMGGAPRLIESEADVGAYLGKTIQISSPMYCSQVVYRYCRTCMGETSWKTKSSITQEGTAVGQGFLGVFMSAMHGKVFDVAEINLSRDLT